MPFCAVLPRCGFPLYALQQRCVAEICLHLPIIDWLRHVCSNRRRSHGQRGQWDEERRTGAALSDSVPLRTNGDATGVGLAGVSGHTAGFSCCPELEPKEKPTGSIALFTVDKSWATMRQERHLHTEE